MKSDTEAEIRQATEEWKEDYIEILTLAAYESYLDGMIDADEILGMPRGPDGKLLDPDKYFNVISEAAMDYSKSYGQILREEGSTVMKGEKVPWLATLEETQRNRIHQIINDGIAEGLPTGVKESADGKYPKGSIAEQLQGYFNDRKSHASTVARTEVARIQNISSLERWKDRGYSQVKVLDGNGVNSCEACNEVNGQTWTLESALERELEHPNCYRAFSPIRKGEESQEPAQ
jgi:SPP1 gp7 family putative phage head morphogenesis protein